MARFAYDVNTTQRYIDVHKQFQGGLKTVDTDDSLGAVFLREAENISLSEFGFLEKRYGTYLNSEQAMPIAATTLQGYFEFEGYKIYAIDGKFFVNNETNHRGIEKEKANEWRYPTLPNYPFFETNFRDMNAVNINKVLYIFTGYYPVYAKVVNVAEEGETENLQLKFYWFSIDIPTYDEIVVVGHNLLEDDYEGLYFDVADEIESNVGDLEVPEDFENDIVIKQSKIQITPKLPFVINTSTDEVDGSITFKSSFKYPSQILTQKFPNNNNYYEMDLLNANYRFSGPGASNLDFINLDLKEVDFKKLSNYDPTSNLNLFIEPEKKIVNKLSTSQPLAEVIASKNKVEQAVNFKFAKLKAGFEIEADADFILSNKGKKLYYSFFREEQDLNQTITRYDFNDFDLIPTITENSFNPFILIKNDNDFMQNAGGFPYGEKKAFITPFRLVDGENIYFEDSKIEITSVSIQDKNYIFEIPSTLDFEQLTGFKIEFYQILVTYGDFDTTIWSTVFYDTNLEKEKIEFSSKVLSTFPHVVTYDTPSAGQNLVNVTIFFKESIGFLEELNEQPFYFDNTPFEVTVSKLTNGVFDFNFEMSISKYELVDGFLSILETNNFNFLFPYVNITAEQLQDFPRKDENSIGIDLPKLKSLWSCNKVLEHFGKLMVWGSTEMPTAVFYSFPDRPTFFPTKFYLDFTNDDNSPVQAVTPYMNILVVQTEEQTWGVRGNSGLIDAPSPYIPFMINPTVGTIAYKSVRPVRNHLFFLSKQGIIALKSLYAADEQYNIDFVDRNIHNIVPQDEKAVGIQFDNQYWLNFPNFGITLRWYVDKKAWVKDTYSAWDDFNGVFKYQIKDGKLEFITLPSRFLDSEVLNIYKVGVDYTLPSDLGGIVTTKFETSFLNQNYPFHPKNYKEAKFDFTLQNEYNISRDSVYQMDFAEHITDGTLHKIDNVSLNKNHRYRIIYNFSDHNIEEDILSGGDFIGVNVPIDVIDGGGFITNVSTIIFGSLTFSLLSAQDLEITSVVITDKDNNQTILVQNEGFNIYSDDTYDYYVDFLLPNSVNGVVDILVTGEFSNYNDGAVMYDITYDSNLVFYNWVISEDMTLNLDNIESYDASKTELNIDFNSRLGTWVFGSSDFGNKVTAVKTQKLSGRGYNAKVYVEDFSRSKWTLESLGLTYKMKRARSR